MIEAAELIAAMKAYRLKLLAAGEPGKAAGVAGAIKIVKRLAK
jgi:hypothetical protein